MIKPIQYKTYIWISRVCSMVICVVLINLLSISPVSAEEGGIEIHDAYSFEKTIKEQAVLLQKYLNIDDFGFLDGDKAHLGEIDGLPIIKKLKTKSMMAFSIIDDSAYNDALIELKMEVKDSKGRELDRALYMKVLKGEAYQSKVLIVFTEPREQQMSILGHVTERGIPDLWMYSESFGSVKKLNLKAASGNMLGMNLGFSDLDVLRDLLRNHLDYKYSYEGEQRCDHSVCDVISISNISGGSSFGKVVMEIDKSELFVRKIEIYNLRQELEKTIRLSELKAFLEGFEVPSVIHLRDETNGEETTIEVLTVSVNNGFTQNEFLPSRLSRVR